MAFRGSDHLTNGRFAESNRAKVYPRVSPSYKFDKLPDTYTIFITEKDFYGEGDPIYNIQRMNLTTGKPFNDGAYILYVNGEYRGDSDIGMLMHDFNCTNAVDMKIDLLAQRTRYLKETPEGVSEMCKEMELMRDKSRAEGFAEGELKGKKDMAMKLYQKHTMTIEQIADAAEVSVEIVRQWFAPIS